MNFDNVKNLLLDNKEVAALYIGSSLYWQKIGGTYTINLNHVTGDATYTNQTTAQTKQFTYETRAGYTFKEYSCSGAGATIDSNGLLTIPAGATGAITVTATYEGVYNISVVSADTSKGTVSGTTLYEYVTGASISPITISATTSPATDYQFDTWTSSVGTMSGNVLTLPANTTGDVTVTATFKEIEYTITVSSADTSKGTVGGTTSFTYTKKAVDQTIKITTTTTAVIGYAFDVFVPSVGTISGTTLTIPANTTTAITVSATWSTVTYAINVTSADTSKGTVSGATEFSYTPAASSQTVSITTICTPTSATYVFKEYTADKSCTFSGTTLTIPAYTTGTISVSANWKTSSLVYYGTATALSTGRYCASGVTVGNHALIGGGYNSNGGALRTVETYDTSLTRGMTDSALSGNTYSNGIGTSNAGDYALFISSIYPYFTDAYNASLEKITATALSGVYYFSTASVSGKALVAGGSYDSSFLSTVNVYDSSLSLSTTTSLTTPRDRAGGATVAEYALFAGGWNDVVGRLATVESYQGSSLTKGMAPSLTTAKTAPESASTGSYAIFVYGNPASVNYNTEVDAYDSSLTKVTSAISPTSISYCTSTKMSASTSLNGYAIFAVGQDVNNSPTSTVDVYNSSLTKVTMTGLNVARCSVASATVGNYALFAGGQTTGYSVVDAYTMS